MRRRSWSSPVLGFSILTATLALYAPVRRFEFINYDDPLYITANSHVREGLSLENLLWSLTSFHAGNWHPLTWTSHLLDVSLFGTWAGGHHMVSALLHGSNAVLLFLFLLSATASRWRSALVAALFAFHPLHVESVAWVAERKDVLSGLLWILALQAYLRYARVRTWPSYTLALAGYAFGLMAKPMVVTLPIVLILVDWWPLGRWRTGGARSFRSLAGEKIPFFLLAGFSSLVTLRAQDLGGSLTSHEALPLAARLPQALDSLLRYGVKSVWPHPLSVFYPYPLEPPGAALTLTAASLVCGGCLLAFSNRRSRPFLITGWLWYLVTLLPVIGLVQVGSQAMADRYTYLPLTGLFLVLVWLLPGPRRPLQPSSIVLAAASLAVLTLCLWGSSTYLTRWRNSMTLMKHAVEAVPDNWLAHANLAQAYGRRGALIDALEHYGASARSRPWIPRVRFNYGIGLARLGMVSDAREEFRAALRLDPALSPARANLRFLERDLSAVEVVRFYRSNLVLQPRNAHSLTALAESYERKGFLADAHRTYREALLLEPAYSRAREGIRRLSANGSRSLPGTGE